MEKRKRQIVLKLIFPRWHVYSLFALVGFVMMGLTVFAFGGSNPAVLGHTLTELQGSSCVGTQKLTVNVSGGLECAADADTDTNTQCDDQNCGTIDVDGLQNSDSSSVAINSDDLSFGSAGGGLSREVLLTNGGRQFSIRVDNSINNGNLIFRDATGGTSKMRIQEGAGAVDIFTSLTVSSSVSVNSGANIVSRCTGGTGNGILTINPGSTCVGVSTDTGLRVS